MKKTFIFVALLVAIFSTSMVQAESFTLINSNFSISGDLSASLYFDDNTYSTFWDHYNTNSATPIADEINYQEAFTRSGASYYNVYAGTGLGDTCVAYECEWWGYASATTTLDFRPNFSGNGSTINITQYSFDPTNDMHAYTNILLTDLTASNMLFESYTSSVGFGSVWTPSDGWSDLIYYDPFLYPFTYDSWNSGHEYRLVMKTDSYPTWNGESGYGEITTDIAFNNVPEPATMLFLGLGLIGVAGVRRKFSH